MELKCPRCGSSIAGDLVNVRDNLAKCDHCDELFKASDLIAATETGRSLEVPSGSSIAVLQRGESEVEIRIPRRRLGLADLMILLFTAFWSTIIGLITREALSTHWAAVLFLVPFWLVGLSLGGGMINAVLERQTIRLGIDQLHIHKWRPLFPRHVSIPYAHIDRVEARWITPGDPFTAMRYLARLSRPGGSGGPWGARVASITYGTRRIPFAEQVSDPEMEWLVSAIDAIVQVRKKSNV